MSNSGIPENERLVALEIFEINLEFPEGGGRLYANGRQQIAILLNIRKTRQNATGFYEQQSLSAGELASIAFRPVGQTSLPVAWTMDVNRNEWANGIASGVLELAVPEPVSGSEEQPIAGSQNFETIRRFMRTTAIQTIALVAQIQLDQPDFQGNTLHITRGQISLSGITPRTQPASTLLHTSRRVLDEPHPSGQKGSYRSLYLDDWTFPQHAPAMNPAVSTSGGARLGLNDNTFFNTFQIHLNGLLRRDRTTISTAEIIVGIGPGQADHNRTFVLRSAPIRTFDYYETPMNNTTRVSPIVITLWDIFGNEYRYRITTSSSPNTVDHWYRSAILDA